jgi:hypothetical protein
MTTSSAQMRSLGLVTRQGVLFAPPCFELCGACRLPSLRPLPMPSRAMRALATREDD